MPNVVYSTAYECAVCHKVYTTKEEAMECEESHKCPCQKWDFCRFGYDEHYGEAYISGVYFKEKRIVLLRNNGTSHERDTIDIKFCPFCGREL